MRVLILLGARISVKSFGINYVEVTVDHDTLEHGIVCRTSAC